MPRENLKRVTVQENPQYYIEDVRSIKIFPESDKIEVETFRKFYDENDSMTSAEAGDSFEVRYTLPEGIYNQIVKSIKQKRR